MDHQIVYIVNLSEGKNFYELPKFYTNEVITIVFFSLVLFASAALLIFKYSYTNFIWSFEFDKIFYAVVLIMVDEKLLQIL